MMRLLHSLSLVLALALAACDFNGQTAASPPPPPPPPVVVPGGSLRSGEISVEHPMPPPGFGLYLYVLPERRVSAAMQAALMRFYGCLNHPGSSDRPPRVALMLMPINHALAGDRIDPALAHDVLRAIPIQESSAGNEVWIVASNKPLTLDAPAVDVTSIPLGRIAPAYVSDWLFRFQDNIEQGAVAAPSDWLPRIKSAGLIFVTIGHEFLGIPAAHAAANACGVEF